MGAQGAVVSQLLPMALRSSVRSPGFSELEQWDGQSHAAEVCLRGRMLGEEVAMTDTTVIF